jgi:hypothetical protein
MFNFAVMNSNIVENIILADSKEIAEQATNKVCLEYTNENPAGIGWTYNEESNIFIPPILDNIE